MAIDFDQIDIVAGDMDATLAFYRRLGVQIPEEAIWRTATGIHHVDITMPSGLIVHFDSQRLAASYNTGWRELDRTRSGNVLSFKVAERDEVDELHRLLTDLGHPSSQAPYDAFWGSRFAIVDDPDGNHIGIMSAADPTRRGAPPDL